MADILFMAANKVNTADPAKGEVAGFKRGDPIVIRPTGWPWGRLEVLPPAEGGDFCRVRLLRADGVTPVWSVPDGWQPGQPYGSPPGKLRDVCERIERSDLIFEGEAGASLGEQTRARAWRILVDTLPAGVISQLNQTGLYEVTVSTVRTYIQNKLSLANPTAEDLGD